MPSRPDSGTLNALLRDLPDEWTRRNEGEGTWSAFDIVAHLIHAERTDWMVRVNALLQFGPAHTFESFDRTGHLRDGHERPLGHLLNEFAQVRSENLRELHALNLQPEDLGRQARHPAFGPVTLSQLLATWAAHDLTHCTRSRASWRTGPAMPWVHGRSISASCTTESTDQRITRTRKDTDKRAVRSGNSVIRVIRKLRVFSG